MPVHYKNRPIPIVAFGTPASLSKTVQSCLSKSIQDFRVQKEGLEEALARISYIWHYTPDKVITRVVVNE